MKSVPSPLGRALPGLVTAVLLAACGAQATPPAASSAPRKYAGRCDLVGIEEVPAPVDQEADSVVLIARYSPGKSRDGRSPLAYRFQIARAREHDLRLHLQANPSVVCEPDENPASRAETAPSFEGQRGQPVAQPAEEGP